METSQTSKGWLTEKVAAVDYETYYDREYSVSSMSYWHYCHDERFDAYRVSIVTNTGIEWVGHPKDAPWDKVKDHVWISHNTCFDSRIHERLQELKVVPEWLPSYWGNTANLAAFLRVGRSMASAVKHLYGVELDKTIRDETVKGLHWSEFSYDLKTRFDAYNLDDSRWCLRIWIDHVAKWPEQERRIADAYDKRSLFGLHADTEGIDADISLLGSVMFEATKRIPWFGETDESGKEIKLMSADACNRECLKRGIECPPNLKQDDPGLMAWENKYGEEHKFVGAMRDYRRANALLEKYKTIRSRIRPTDGRFEVPLSYMGTHTGRSSGKNKNEEKKQKGFNMLNMARDPLYIREDMTTVCRKDEMKAIATHLKKFGCLPDYIKHSVYLRKRITPGRGKKFIIFDLSQIEPRCLLLLARDTEFLNLIRSGLSVYEAHAIATMGYVKQDKKLKDVDAGKYALAKARILALGYGAGHMQFIEMAPQYISDDEFREVFDRPVSEAEVTMYLEWLTVTKQKNLVTNYHVQTEEMKRIRVNSWKIVQDYRMRNPKICNNSVRGGRKPGVWKQLQDDMESCVGKNYSIELPSGRCLHYFDVTKEKDGLVATTEMGTKPTHFYGGRLAENATQAFARDVFVDLQLRLLDLGFYVVLDIYDECVIECDESVSPDSIVPIVTTPPSFAKSLPLACEIEESTFYKK